jgi:eIF-2B alpha/beta/delta-like uncharacterized protein
MSIKIVGRRMERRDVVTSFLEHEGKILILRRSEKVGTYRGRWAGVSGYLEEGEDPLHRALQELREEVGLTSEQVQLLRKGKPLLVPDLEKKVVWKVYPFLFRVKSDRIQMDWEHRECQWIRPEEIGRYETVPKLEETLERVWEKPGGQPLDPQVLREIELIKADRWKGASQLAREALRVVKLAAERYSPPKAADAGDYLGYLKQVGRLLMEARPSMAALANSVGFLLHQLLEKGKTEPPFSLRAFALSKAEELIRQSEEASAAAARKAAELFPRKAKVMTHSYSSTVLQAFHHALQAGKGVEAVVTESRPLCEGTATAKALSEMGIPVAFIVDAAAGCFMDRVDLVLVGADSILADGSAVNKVGTLTMALAARRSRVPFYVVCERLKFHVRSLLGEAVALEEKDPSEVVNPQTLPGVGVRNVYFDITPADCLSGIVTEDGVLKPPSVSAHMEEMLKNLYLE